MLLNASSTYTSTPVEGIEYGDSTPMEGIYGDSTPVKVIEYEDSTPVVGIEYEDSTRSGGNIIWRLNSQWRE